VHTRKIWKVYFLVQNKPVFVVSIQRESKNHPPPAVCGFLTFFTNAWEF